MTKINTQPRFNKYTVTGALLVCFLLILAGVYLFVWRPADSDYQSASQYVKSLENSHKTLVIEVSSLDYPGKINTNTPLKMQALLDTFNKSVEDLANSPVSNRDFTVKANYERYGDQFVEYKELTSQLVTSIELYVATLDTCREFTDIFDGSNFDSYSKLLEECRAAIEKGKTSKHEPFNDQFLNKYLEQTSKYIEAVDVMTTATNSETAISANKTMSEAYGKILDLGANKLDFKLPDLMSELESLKETLDSQKNAFWR